MDHVGLENLSPFGVEQLFELVTRHQTLAPGQRNFAFGGDLTEPLRQFPPGRLLDEQRPERRNSMRKLNRRPYRERLPHFETDIEIRPAAPTDCFHLGGETPQPLRLRPAFWQHPLDTRPPGRAHL